MRSSASACHSTPRSGSSAPGTHEPDTGGELVMDEQGAQRTRAAGCAPGEGPRVAFPDGVEAQPDADLDPAAEPQLCVTRQRCAVAQRVREVATDRLVEFSEHRGVEAVARVASPRAHCPAFARERPPARIATASSAMSMTTPTTDDHSAMTTATSESVDVAASTPGHLGRRIQVIAAASTNPGADQRPHDPDGAQQRRVRNGPGPGQVLDGSSVGGVGERVAGAGQMRDAVQPQHHSEDARHSR